MNDYWLSKASEAEALLDTLRSQYEQMKLDYERKIQDLERELLEANCNIQTSQVQQKK